MTTPAHAPFAALTDSLLRREAEASARLDGETHVIGAAQPDAVELDATARAYAAELEDALAARDGLNQLIEECKAAIQRSMGDASEATIDGRPAFTYRRSTRRTFDQATAKRFLSGEQLAACEKATEVRTFRRVTE